MRRRGNVETVEPAVLTKSKDTKPSLLSDIIRSDNVSSDLDTAEIDRICSLSAAASVIASESILNLAKVPDDDILNGNPQDCSDFPNCPALETVNVSASSLSPSLLCPSDVSINLSSSFENHSALNLPLETNVYSVDLFEFKGYASNDSSS